MFGLLHSYLQEDNFGIGSKSNFTSLTLTGIPTHSYENKISFLHLANLPSCFVTSTIFLISLPMEENMRPKII